MLDQRGRLLRVTLGSLMSNHARTSFSFSTAGSTRGPGSVTSSPVWRQGYDLALRRTTGKAGVLFFPSGFEQSLTAHAGNAWYESLGGGTTRLDGNDDSPA